MKFPWIPDSNQVDCRFSEIIPDAVLYEYDGPMIFTAQFGRMPLLCYKIEEDDGLDQYIVVKTNSGIIDKLQSGRMAVRTALLQAWGWIIVADRSYRVVASWEVSSDVIPDEFLPDAGYGLYPEHGIIRESADHSSFLSIYFKGDTLNNGTLPLNVVRKLFDDVYSTIWQVYAPAIKKAAPNLTDKALRKAFSVQAYEPQFASLKMDFEKPTLDFSDFQEAPEVDVAAAERNIALAHADFLNSANAVATAAAGGRLSGGFASQYQEAIEAFSQLMPSKNSFFESVKINGISGESGRNVSLSIDVDMGNKIREAYKISAYNRRTITGNVVEVNSSSFTFIIRMIDYRQVTCVALTYEAREAIAGLKSGATAAIVGPYLRRTRRDMIWIEGLKINDEPIL